MAPSLADDPPSAYPPWFRSLLALFVISGSGGLLAQVCYSKYLLTIVGATAHATSAVLAAFMTGLALGAALGGRWSKQQRRPLVGYAAAEFVVAGALALGPSAFALLTELYVSLATTTDSIALLTLLRWLVALGVVIVPTTAMGATLPILAAGLGSPSVRQRRLGALYAANTLGGATGALIGAYAIIPSLGLSASLYGAATCSVASSLRP